jgi:hypothetical protein
LAGTALLPLQHVMLRTYQLFYIHNGIDSGQFTEDESSLPPPLYFFMYPTLSCGAFVRFHQGKSEQTRPDTCCLLAAPARHQLTPRDRGLLNFGPSSRNGFFFFPFAPLFSSVPPFA